MLRLILVLALILIGWFFAAQSAFYALLFYLWNAYFRPDAWTYGGLIRSLNLSYLIGAYLVVRTLMSVPRPQFGLRTGLIFLFAVQAFIGTLSSEHPEISQPFLIDLVKVLVICYLIVIILDDRQKFRVTMIVIVASLGFECAKQGWVNLYRAPGARNDNPIPFLGDNNGVALGTMMLIPLIGALAQTASARWEKNLHRFVAIGVFLRGISTYSRGGFLAAAVLGLFSFLRSQKKARTILVIGAGCLLVWNLMPAGYWMRIDTITVEEEEQRDSSAAGRLHFWHVAVDMAAAKPMTGVGLNSFSASYNDYNTNIRFGGSRAAHSTWFGVLGDLGYPGLLLVLANWSLALYSCWRVSQIARGNPARRELGLYANALMTSFTVFAVAGTFLSSQYNEMFWHFVALATALHGIALREMAAQQAVVPSQRFDVQATPTIAAFR